MPRERKRAEESARACANTAAASAVSPTDVNDDDNDDDDGDDDDGDDKYTCVKNNALCAPFITR